MCLRRLGGRSPSCLTWAPPHNAVAVLTVARGATAHTSWKRNGASHAVAPSAHPPRQQASQSYATFRRLLRSMQEAPSRGRGCGAAEAAIPVDEPLAANTALMEQLGVMDLSERRTDAFVASMAPTDGAGGSSNKTTTTTTTTIDTPPATALTEACRAGVACHLPPTVILRRIAAAAEKSDSHAGWMPPVAAAVLLRCAADRITSRYAALQRCRNGRDAVPPRQDALSWPRSDQGEAARLQWALAEEIRRGYEILTRLPQRRHEAADVQATERDDSGGVQDTVTLQTGHVDELRGRLELAVALQDGAAAVDAVERLFALYGQSHRAVSDEAQEQLRADLMRDVCAAVSAFHAGRDFAAGRVLYEKLASVLPLVAGAAPGLAAGTSDGLYKESGGGHSEAAAVELAGRLRLLTALANCVDTSAAHFTYVRDAVVKLFANTDAGYLPATRRPAQEGLCAVLHALARVTLEPRARMAEAQSVFCAVQQNSHADVAVAAAVTEALLQVASAARDSSAALLLYNQLAAPKTHRAEVPANIMAVLVAEKDALDDFARFLSFVGLRRRVMASSAAHLLAAKLLLQRRPSEVVYTVLDLIHAKHEVEPQRTFFLRLLALYRDLQQRMSTGDAAAPPPAHAQRILADWQEALRRTGVRTLAFTTLQLLQRIRRQLLQLTSPQVRQQDSAERTAETTSSLLALIEGMLQEFSLGWLNHRATASRTPRYYVTSPELRRWVAGETSAATEASQAGVVVRTLRDPVTPPETVAALSVEERRVLVRKAWEALCAANNAGGKVVLGFSDFVRLCWLEDASLFGSSAAAPAAAASAEELLFSLDTLNSRVPPLHVTDALGEAILHGDPHASPASVVLQRDVSVAGAPPASPRRRYNRTTEEEWLARWLDEAGAALPVERGVFEEQLERLLRMTPLVEGTLGEEDGGRKASALQCFVDVA
ncbi:uncharacterized protein Tco025E_05859 [Trypanosoma conorhini]|uniref:Uncharacterized protein n=1 Tax=Trypanosoma conorhini TaxID=83891 RepID=A0A422PA02_9TRYP|nr:uncharacterized protein Tco025E_05859 [Trypanosoma conorhini]RNF14551.1 hypothetical protein Tco025E_05859 [Trypanosoma conorhini]